MTARSPFPPPIHRAFVLQVTSVVSAVLVILALVVPVQTTQAQTSSDKVVSWVHIGDLHMVDTTLSNYSDLKTIVNDINSYMKDGINFAYLPGDNANDGLTSEYQLIHGVIQNLQVPLKAVLGDHDKKGQIADFEQYIYPRNPDSFNIGNYHFALLDSFNLQNQMSFLKADLDAARAAGKQSVLMFHQFDVNQLGSDLQSVIQNDNVILVDTGHTHTNVLANDGHTVYAATRSTGQATEGPVGFSIVSLDGGVVSWKFQPLGQWPFVMITSPSDQALITNQNGVVKGSVQIHAKAFSDATITSASYQIDGGSKAAMNNQGNALWTAPWNSSTVPNGAHTLLVTVTDSKGKTGTDQFPVLVNQSGTYTAPTRSFGPEGNSLAANPVKGLLGASGAGGAKGGAKGAGKGGSGPKGCTTTGTVTPTPTATATSASTTAQKGGHGKGSGCSGPGGGGAAGKGRKGGGKHGPKGKAACTSSSTTSPTPTTTASSTPIQQSGHGKGHGGCGGPGGRKGRGKHGPKGAAASSTSPSVTPAPTGTATTP
ncbi:MAG: hypothetical protein NVS2B16_17830 [Chloroflexota bacterium]